MGAIGNLRARGMLGLSRQKTSLVTTFASGKHFPVWNTLSGGKVIKLQIFGSSRQDVIPSISDPSPIASTDDALLLVSNDREGNSRQLFNLSDYLLRSLPSGICDEIIYNNGVWTFIQRIKEYVIDDNSPVILDSKTPKAGIIGYKLGNIIGGDEEYTNDSITDNSFSNKFKFISGYKASIANTLSVGEAAVAVRGDASSILDKYVYFWIPLDIYNAGLTAAKEYLKGTTFTYYLPMPIEKAIDLPEMQMYNGQTWFFLDSKLDTYMKGTFKVRKSVNFIPGAIYHYYFGGKTNQDTDKTTIDDLSGNGNTLTLYGFNYTPESGYIPGGLRFDGINDYCTPNKNNSYKTVQISFSSLIPQKDKNTYLFGNFNAVNNGEEREIGMLWGESPTFKSRLVTQGYEKVFDNETPVPVETAALLGTITSSSEEAGRKRVISTVISRDTQVPNKLYLGSYYPGGNYSDYILHEFIAYERELSEDEIKHNVKVLQQRNGIGDNTEVLPVTYASGRLFPIWNTISGNNIARLQIFGETTQQNIPSLDTPVSPVNRIDGTLEINTSDGIEEGAAKNTVTFEEITLRSLPSGTADELLYENGIWKLIKRTAELNIIKINSLYDVGKNVPGYVSGIINVDRNNENGLTSKMNSLGFSDKLECGIAQYLNPKEMLWNHDTIDGVYYIRLKDERIGREQSDTNEQITAKINAYLTGNPVTLYYELLNPTEKTVIPSSYNSIPKTFDNTTYLYAEGAYSKCTCRVSQKLDFIEGSRCHYYFGDKTNNDSDRDTIKNKSENRYDLQLQNFAYTVNSGYIKGGIQTDGIDDHIQTTLDFIPRSVFISCSTPPVDENRKTSYDTILARENISDLFNRTSLFNYKDADGNRIRSNAAQTYINGILSEPNTTAPFNQVNTYTLIMADFDLTNWYFNLSGVVADSGEGVQWPAKAGICEVLCYDRELSYDEISHNTKVMQQRNGIVITNYKL